MTEEMFFSSRDRSTNEITIGRNIIFSYYK